VLNAGSGTLKWTLLDGRDRSTLQAGSEEWGAPQLEGRALQIRATLSRGARFEAGGHRVVHGGTPLLDAAVIDSDVRAALETLAELDPLHMRPALAGIDAVSDAFPTVTQVAAFDTSFHATMPQAAAGYALPFEWSERWGLKRFGFHGLSVQYSVAQAEVVLGRAPARMIVCHLGSGCSL